MTEVTAKFPQQQFDRNIIFIGVKKSDISKLFNKTGIIKKSKCWIMPQESHPYGKIYELIAWQLLRNLDKNDSTWEVFIFNWFNLIDI